MGERNYWIKPSPRTKDGEQQKLKVFNSLTKRKDEFVAINGNLIKWYVCGPTVYDSSHLGHARNYVSTDILRRVMEKYFGYQVYMVMNITDIDDKIIVRGRQRHLVEKYISEHGEVNEQVEEELKGMLGEYARDKIKEVEQFREVQELVKQVEELFKINSDNKEMEKVLKGWEELLKSRGKETKEVVRAIGEDIVAKGVDKKYANMELEPQIFKRFTEYWEADFMADMDSLHVARPDVLTRVTEFIPEIEQYIDRIIKNGYAYEANGSVYFAVGEFDGKNSHTYAKLEPKSKDNSGLLEEGEGSLGSKLEGKRSKADFALWKASKPGEPYWDSKFGKGRPGWHIECSVMASHVLGEQLDIHSGGIDLAFPHHDNELAQAEAHFESQQWVNYFLHTGHLHIQGFKMSKSLKNFITIKEALNLYSPRQLRLYFLNQRWDAPCDFKPSSLHEAISAESFVLNFFTNLDAKIRSFAPPSASSTSHDHNSAEADLIADLFNTQQAVHSALCDSFDTPSVLKLLLSLINKANIYLSSTSFSPSPLLSISKYLTFIFDVFGVSFTSTSTSTSTSSSAPDSTAAIDHSSLLLPYLTTFSTFRDQVRQAAKIAKNSDILGLCDTFRDTELTKYGVVLDDQESGPALIKLVDPAYLKQQQQQQLQAEDQKKAAKQLAQQRKVDKLELAKIPPHQYFTTGGRGVEFSSFDLNGFPLTDLEGKPLSKSKVKKLQKLYDNHTKIHNDYLASIEGK